MFGERYELEGTLEVLSPLHVGTGEAEPLPGIGGRQGSNDETPAVVRLMTDRGGRPWLPPTTLKGMLRDIAGDILTEAERVDLFGSIKDNQTAGAMGALLPRGAVLAESARDLTAYPYAATAHLATGAFVAARTAIDVRTGVADEHKLFFQEMIAPGATFSMRLVLLAGDGNEARLKSLLLVLAELTVESGVPCGRGKADGSGALRLRAGSITVTRRSIDKDGILDARKLPDCVLAAQKSSDGADVWRGTFVCKGPFLSVDSSHDPKKTVGNENVPQLTYQRGQNDQPLELGSQVAGVLRARARWLMGLRALQDGRDPAAVDPGAVDDATARARIIKTPSSIATLALTPVEKLFGVGGFAGLLAIESLRFRGATPYNVTSVKLDQFSGAPIDNALFTTRAVTGARFELALKLRRRRGGGAPSEADKKLFVELTDDLMKSGLSLGHGWAKGFGWFEYVAGGENAGPKAD